MMPRVRGIIAYRVVDLEAPQEDPLSVSEPICGAVARAARRQRRQERETRPHCCRDNRSPIRALSVVEHERELHVDAEMLDGAILGEDDLLLGDPGTPDIVHGVLGFGDPLSNGVLEAPWGC